MFTELSPIKEINIINFVSYLKDFIIKALFLLNQEIITGVFCNGINVIKLHE